MEIYSVYKRFIHDGTILGIRCLGILPMPITKLESAEQYFATLLIDDRMPQP